MPKDASGCLVKQGEKFKTWKKRFFVFGGAHARRAPHLRAAHGRTRAHPHMLPKLVWTQRCCECNGVAMNR